MNEPHHRNGPGDCCPQMRAQLEFECKTHPDVYACPDQLITYEPSFQEFGLIVHDGGSSSVTIAFCPWCGVALPPSQRDRWFDELERVGIDDPRDAPPAMQTRAWLVHDPQVATPDVGMSAEEAEALAVVVRALVPGTVHVQPDGEFFSVAVATDRGVFTLYDELDWRWLRPRMT